MIGYLEKNCLTFKRLDSSNVPFLIDANRISLCYERGKTTLSPYYQFEISAFTYISLPYLAAALY